MSKRLSSLIPFLLFSATACVFARVMPAQAMPPQPGDEAPKPEKFHLIPLNDVFDEAFSRHSGDFYFQASLAGQVVNFFGLQYYDNDIISDSQLLNYYQREAMRQQNDFAPVLRGRDLPNPFDSSVQENPCYLRTPSEGYCGK